MLVGIFVLSLEFFDAGTFYSPHCTVSITLLIGLLSTKSDWNYQDNYLIGVCYPSIYFILINKIKLMH